MVKKFFFFIILFSLATSNLSAAALSYLVKKLVPQTSFENPSTNWNASDDAVSQIDIGFTFRFNNTNYTKVYIDSNGYISFNSISSKYNNTALAASHASQFIFPYWDDMNRNSGGTIKYQTLGNSSNRHLVISWNSVPHYSNSGSYSFQVVLYEDGGIRFRYLAGSNADGTSYGGATVGVQEDSSHYDQHAYKSAINQSQDILYIPIPVNVNGTTPACPTPVQKLGLETFTNNAGYPSDRSQYQSLINTYAKDQYFHGSGYVDRIYTSDGSNNNPYHSGTDDSYLAVFAGYIYFPVAGIYKFGIDGDDALEFFIDNVFVTGWYGGHGRSNRARYVKYVEGTQGWHKIAYHMEEGSGGDNYYLYWQRADQSSIVVTPASALFHCVPTIIKSSSVVSDPINGTSNPKRIPGAIIRYTLTSKNLALIRFKNVKLKDTLPSDLEWVANTLKITTPSVNSGSQKSLTDASDADEGTFDGTKTEINCGILQSDKECIVVFDAKVK